MKDLLEKINNCSSEEEVDKLIEEALNYCINNSEKKDLGFPHGSNKCSLPHKGFIHPDSRIRFDSMSLMSYKMKTMDFYYEFGRKIYKNKIKDLSSLISYLMTFINWYFGINNGKDVRDDYFSEYAFGMTETDEELFKAIDNFEIGNMRGKKIAMCTDRSAMAQNLLSLFGLESYYCTGCYANSSNESAHCFNVVKASNCYRIVDYSILCGYYKNGALKYYLPLVSDIPIEKTENFLFNSDELEASAYEYNSNQDGLKKDKIKDVKYLVGKVAFNKSATK